MASTTRLPKHWEETGTDSRYTRKFGPITAVCTRHIDYKDESASYAYGYLDVNHEGTEFRVPYASLGAQWWEDDADVKAIRVIEKQMKNVIRAWAR